MCSALDIEDFSVMMSKTTELIGHTYKSGSNVKSCLGRMKEIALPKPKP